MRTKKGKKMLLSILRELNGDRARKALQARKFAEAAFADAVEHYIEHAVVPATRAQASKGGRRVHISLNDSDYPRFDAETAMKIAELTGDSYPPPPEDYFHSVLKAKLEELGFSVWFERGREKGMYSRTYYAELVVGW